MAFLTQIQEPQRQKRKPDWKLIQATVPDGQADQFLEFLLRGPETLTPQNDSLLIIYFKTSLRAQLDAVVHIV